MTTPHLTRIKSLCASIEPAFSTVVSGAPSLSGWARIPAEDINFQPSQEYLERNVQLDTLGKITGAIGAKGGTLSFKVGLVGRDGGSAFGAGGYLDILLKKSCMASSQSSSPATISSGATTSAVTLTPAAPADTFIGVELNGVLEVRRVTNVVGGVSQVNPPFSRAPLTSDSAVIADAYKIEDASPGTVSFVMKGDGFTYTLTGCKSTPPKLTVTARARPMLEFSFQVDDWTTATAWNDPPALPIVPAIVAQSSPFYWKTEGGTATVPVTEAAFDYGATLTPMNSTVGKNGRAGYALTEIKPVLTFKPYYDPDYRNDFAAGNTHDALLQIGSGLGRAAAVFLRKAQINAYPGETDLSGLVGHDVKIQCTVGDSAGIVAQLAFF